MHRSTALRAHLCLRPCHSFTYQAQSWNKPRRVVAKVEWGPASCIRIPASLSPTWRGRPSVVGKQRGRVTRLPHPKASAPRDRATGTSPALSNANCRPMFLRCLRRSRAVSWRLQGCNHHSAPRYLTVARPTTIPLNAPHARPADLGLPGNPQKLTQKVVVSQHGPSIATAL